MKRKTGSVVIGAVVLLSLPTAFYVFNPGGKLSEVVHRPEHGNVHLVKDSSVLFDPQWVTFFGPAAQKCRIVDVQTVNIDASGPGGVRINFLTPVDFRTASLRFELSGSGNSLRARVRLFSDPPDETLSQSFYEIAVPAGPQEVVLGSRQFPVASGKKNIIGFSLEAVDSSAKTLTEPVIWLHAVVLSQPYAINVVSKKNH